MTKIYLLKHEILGDFFFFIKGKHCSILWDIKDEVDIEEFYIEHNNLIYIQTRKLILDKFEEERFDMTPTHFGFLREKYWKAIDTKPVTNLEQFLTHENKGVRLLIKEIISDLN